MKLTYEGSGVDPAKADDILESFADFLKSRPKDPNLLSGIGPYASCYSMKSLLKGMDDPILVTSCDGVGTKAMLALEWNALEGLGQDLVAMNVNDLLCVGSTPLLFLDYYACGTLEKPMLTKILKSIQEACEVCGCSLAGGETAEMPGLYRDKDFDLAGFAIGVMDKKNLLPRVEVGDDLVALNSSGAHSNGYSLIRKIVESQGLKPDAKNPFDGRTWRETLLAPTILYVPYLKDALNRVSGLCHVTGSGVFGNLPRILKPNQKAVIDSKSWPLSPLFQWIQGVTRLSTKDLLTTFNGGVGMIVATRKESTAQLMEHCSKRGLTALPIGTVEKSDSEEAFVEWR